MDQSNRTVTLLIQIFFIFALIFAANGFSAGRVETDDSENRTPYMDHDHGHGDDNHTGDGGMDHSMKMYFHASAMSMILFKGWMTHSWEAMLGSCVGLFIIAVLYEGLKIGRELLQKKMTPAATGPEVYPVSTLKGSDQTNYETHSSQHSMIDNRKMGKVGIFSASHIIQTLLHFVQVWLSFCLMLVFMTYNIWLCLSVTLGAAVGYFCFAWLKSSGSDTNEHCN